MTAAAPNAPHQTNLDWVKRNLFPNWWSGVLSVVLLPLSVYGAYRGLRFLFVTGEWDAVRVKPDTLHARHVPS